MNILHSLLILVLISLLLLFLVMETVETGGDTAAGSSSSKKRKQKDMVKKASVSNKNARVEGKGKKVKTDDEKLIFYVNVKIVDWRAEYPGLVEKGPNRFEVQLYKIDKDGHKRLLSSQPTRAYDVTSFELPVEWLREMLPAQVNFDTLTWEQVPEKYDGKHRKFELEVREKGIETAAFPKANFTLEYVNNMVMYSVKKAQSQKPPLVLLSKRYQLEEFQCPRRSMQFHFDFRPEDIAHVYTEWECFDGWEVDYEEKIVLSEHVCVQDRYRLRYGAGSGEYYEIHCDEAIYERPRENVYKIRWTKQSGFTCELDKEASKNEEKAMIVSQEQQRSVDVDNQIIAAYPSGFTSPNSANNSNRFTNPTMARQSQNQLEEIAVVDDEKRVNNLMGSGKQVKEEEADWNVPLISFTKNKKIGRSDGKRPAPRKLAQKSGLSPTGNKKSSSQTMVSPKQEEEEIAAVNKPEPSQQQQGKQPMERSEHDDDHNKDGGTSTSNTSSGSGNADGNNGDDNADNGGARNNNAGNDGAADWGVNEANVALQNLAAPWDPVWDDHMFGGD